MNRSQATRADVGINFRRYDAGMASCSKPAAPVRFLGQRSGCYRRNQETTDKKAYRGRLSLLNALSDALERHTVKNVPQALKLEAAHYFGSLEKAIATLNKQGKRLPRLEQTKNHDRPFPDTSIQREIGLRESTT